MVTMNLQHGLDGAIHALPIISTTDPRADLDAWEDVIAEMDTALCDLAAARAQIDELTAALDAIEAGHVLDIEGGNAEQRKARLTLALADDGRYQTAHSRRCEARQRLLDAERRVELSRQRTRLLWASVALQQQRP